MADLNIPTAPAIFGWSAAAQARPIRVGGIGSLTGVVSVWGRALREGLGQLNPRAAEAFVLRYLEGMSNGEVAATLGTSAPVVAVTLHRARRTLQKHIEKTVGEQS